MTNWDLLTPYLPSEWLSSLRSLPQHEQDAIQEIRLRKNQPVTLSMPAGDRYLCMASSSTLHQSDTYICHAEQLETCFLCFCEHSVYAHEEELRQGYISVAGGIRVGVVGTAVLEGSEVRAVRQITSLCIRLPREHVGCGSSLLGLIAAADGLHSTLLVGEPSSGKTSLLRDLAAGLAVRGVRVAVVDERGEIAGAGDLRGCDVLRGYPKVIGVLQAVRCLAPQVVIFDELGTQQEIRTVSACAHMGVAVVASLHGHDPYRLQEKPSVRKLIAEGLFDRWVFLRGRCAPGVWDTCLMPEVRCGEVCWHSVDRCCGQWDGDVLLSSAVSAG